MHAQRERERGAVERPPVVTEALRYREVSDGAFGFGVRRSKRAEPPFINQLIDH